MGSAFSTRRSQQNLAAAQHKGIRRTQSRLDLALFVFGDWSDKERSSHALSYITLPASFGGNALGAPPQTSIAIYISRNEGSEQLAMDFVALFARRWPCALDNLSGLTRQVYTPQEVRVLQEEGRGLSE